jgi:endonuclease III
VTEELAAGRTPLEWPQIVDRLDEQHGPAQRDPLPLGNKLDPYDELIYILLTVMTRSQPRIDRAYEGLRTLCGDQGWSGLLAADRDELRSVLEPLGFVNRRTEQLVGTVTAVEQELDGSLEVLRGMDDHTALETLLALPGVGGKTAKCVLMYSLDRAVLPVDIHVLRVGKRLGVIAEGASWREAGRQLDWDVPDELKYAVHVQFVIHGREVCTGPKPDCSGCVLEPDCPVGHLAPRLRSHYTNS